MSEVKQFFFFLIRKALFLAVIAVKKVPAPLFSKLMSKDVIDASYMQLILHRNRGWNR